MRITRAFVVIVAAILFGVCSFTLSAQPLAPVVEKIKTSLPGAGEHMIKIDLGVLENGLAWYFPFDGHLTGWNPNGSEVNARFQRTTNAYLPDLTPTYLHEPRFWKGMFDRSVLIEYGACASGRHAGSNFLPAHIAEADNPAKGFKPVGGAKVRKTKGRQGEAALAVTATGAGGGIVTDGVSVPKTSRQSYSVYLRGNAGRVVDLVALAGGSPLGKAEVTLTGGWQQAGVDYGMKLARGEKQGSGKTPAISLKITTREPGEFFVDALMLESHHGYTGRESFSTWIDPGVRRAADLVQFGAPVKPSKGTLAFRAKLFGRMKWRNLLTIGGGHGWSAPLRLDIRDDARIEIALKNKRSGRADIPNPTEWHHYAVTWNRKSITVYLDGKQVLRAQKPKTTFDQVITLGGVATNFSPAVRANAYFDEFAHWNRALSLKELNKLASLAGPMAAGMNLGVTINDLEPIKVFARDDIERLWSISVVNRSAKALEGVSVRYGIKNLFTNNVSVPSLPGGHQARIKLPWSPARLVEGKYNMTFTLSAGGRQLREVEALVEIARARVPKDNIQVITWGGLEAVLYELGITVGGITGVADGPKAREVATAARRRLYVQLRQFMHGEPKTDMDRFWNAAGKPAGTDHAANAPKRDIVAKARRLAKRLELFPDVRYTIINTEHQTIWTCDFRPESIKEANRRFGLDLSPWAGADEKKLWAVVHPMGRLSAAWGKVGLPPGGIVPGNNPFYAYHRWWHGDTSGTEVLLNELIIREIKGRAPWVRTIIEPILRRPAVRAYDEHDITEEWYYYPNPLEGLWVGERLAASARTTNSTVSGMPQFLFKPGMAAPYGGMPAPHLFRETVWCCISRPISNMTYWALNQAISRGNKKETKTQTEIDKIFGPTPEWKAVEKKIKRRGEYTSVFLWIPELRDEIKRMHNEVIHPLGALIPAWRNSPRRIAVFFSFAGQLYNNVRWPGRPPLMRALNEYPLPFDVLYDQDFEGDSAVSLDSYDVIVIPESPVVYKPALAPLKKFIARGGLVLVDDYFRAKLDGITQLKWKGVKEKDPLLKELEQALLKKYGRSNHPMFVEAMQEATRDKRKTPGPSNRALALVDKAVRSPVRVATRAVHANLLEADGAYYLVLINDLRVPGKHYGHFGKVREQGVAQTAQVEIEASLGSHAYDLLAHKKLRLKTTASKANALNVKLPPAGGRVIALLPSDPHKIELTVTEQTDALVALRATLTDIAGLPLVGIIPCKVSITRPDGTTSDRSCYAAFRRGKLLVEWPRAYNAAPGTYTLTVTEMATGKSAKIAWEVADK